MNFYNYSFKDLDLMLQSTVILPSEKGHQELKDLIKKFTLVMNNAEMKCCLKGTTKTRSPCCRLFLFL